MSAPFQRAFTGLFARVATAMNLPVLSFSSVSVASRNPYARREMLLKAKAYTLQSGNVAGIPPKQTSSEEQEDLYARLEGELKRQTRSVPRNLRKKTLRKPRVEQNWYAVREQELLRQAEMKFEKPEALSEEPALEEGRVEEEEDLYEKRERELASQVSGN